jgi:putative DNA primase/helicase
MTDAPAPTDPSPALKVLPFTSPAPPPIAVSLLPFPLTDTGNAERLLAAFPNKFRYCSEARSWRIWNRKAWRPDPLETIYSHAQAVIRELYRQTDQIEEPTYRDKVRKFALQSERSLHQTDLITQFRRLHGVSILSSAFDKDLLLFNLQNGTLNLLTGKLHRHDPLNLITKISPVRFDPSAQCPTFLNFLHQIMSGNQNLIDYLQTCFGYSLTGDTSERSVFCLIGDGSNGKTTLLKIIHHIMGDYGSSIMIKTLMDTRESDSLATTSDLANLAGSRFVTASEAKKQQKLSEHLIKHITSTDKIRVCLKYQNPFEFAPTHKLFIDANYRPKVTGADYAIWSRLNLIPFEVSIPEADQDLKLFDKLVEEAPGILNWMLTGCLRWLTSRLAPPEEVRAATTAWKADDDPLSEFFADCCEFSPKFFTPVSELNTELKQWWALNFGDIPRPSAQDLNDRLRRLKAVKSREYLPDGTRVRAWRHVRLTQYAIIYHLTN